jgi:hypothetical protein
VSWIARASAQRCRKDNDRDRQQFWRQQASQPQPARQSAATICTMRLMRDRHADHPISRRDRLRAGICNKSPQERGNY